VTMKQCGTCTWWIKPRRPKTDTGQCRDAIKRARNVVPFSVNLTVSPTYATSGGNCPCYEPLRQWGIFLRKPSSAEYVQTGVPLTRDEARAQLRILRHWEEVYLGKARFRVQKLKETV
jgi:hypothetical protein